MDIGAVSTLAAGIEAFDDAASQRGRVDMAHVVVATGRQHRAQVRTDDLDSGVTEQCCGPAVPRHEDPVAARREDRISRRFDDG